MLKKSKYIALICGAISIAVTVIFYLLTFDNKFTVPMRWLSLMFLILSEAIGSLKAVVVKKNILNFANIVTSVIHIAFVLLISITFVNIYPLLIKKYVLLNILALCVVFAVDIIISFFSNSVATQDKQLKISQSVMQSCVDKAASLCVEFENTEYKKDLEEIFELLKYSDNSCLSQDEMAIMNKLDELPLLLHDGKDVTEKIIDIKNIVKLRSIKVASSKRGNY